MRLVRRSDISRQGRHSNVKWLGQCSDISHLERRMSEILRTWLDGFARLIGPVGSICLFHLALQINLKCQSAWSVYSIWHCGRRKTSHFWCQTELILVQTKWPQTGYMFVLDSQRVLSLEMTSGGKPPHTYHTLDWTMMTIHLIKSCSCLKLK